MKALWFDGKHIRLRNLRIPSLKKNEALIEVHYAGICNTDLEIFKGYMKFKGVPGHEFIGKVVDGPAEWLSKRVVGEINIACGRCKFCKSGLNRHCPERRVLGISGKNGAFAEYLSLPVSNLHPIPNSISDLEAVFVEPLSAALRILDQVRIKKQESVFLFGDGKLAQLIARIVKLETENLLVIGRHKKKLSLLENLGIRTILAEKLGRIKPVEKPELVIEATGDESGLRKALEVCKPTGTIILKSTFHQMAEINLSKIVVDELILIGSRCGDFHKAIEYIKNKKVLLKDMVSGIYGLAEFEKAFKKSISRNAIKVLFKCH